MHHFEWHAAMPHDVTALLAIAAGILCCFWGYRLLKVSLAITGFVAGAIAGWNLGLNMAPNNSLVPLLCALIGGVIGMLLCIWIYFLGIFLLGASFGAALALAVLPGQGGQSQLVLVLAFAVVFGALALALRRLMVIVATAFGGSSLVVSGAMHFALNSQNPLPPFLGQTQLGPTKVYLPLVAWVVLGLIGLSVQFRHRHKREEAVKEKK